MPDSLRGLFSRPRCAAFLILFLAPFGISAGLAAQDAVDNTAASACSARSAPDDPPSSESTEQPPPSRHVEPAQTAAEAKLGNSGAAPASTDSACTAPPETGTQFSHYISQDLFSSSSAASQSPDNDLTPDPRDTRAANLYAIAHPTNGKYPVTLRTGRWGGEEWEPAFLQTLGFSIAQNGYRLATEEKTRHALLLETWHSYYEAISGLHTWSDGGKTWTVYIAHPAQGAVFNDIWTEHDPHGALVPFGFNKPYWGSRLKAFWWDSLWELQWKFGPFSEASIGNVGLIPGKLGANTIVSSAVIGTGLAAGEDALDRYGIAKWERHTNNRVAVGFLRTGLNPDRSFANLFRKKWPWYRDRRPTLRDREPPLP